MMSHLTYNIKYVLKETRMMIEINAVRLVDNVLCSKLNLHET